MDSELIAERLGVLLTKVESIEGAVLGSERGPGLVQKVEKLEGDRNKLWGIGSGIIGVWSILEFLFHRGAHK